MAKNILLIDDDPSYIHNVRKLLVEEGYRLFLATNGHLACRIAEERSIDVVIVDWEMPDMNGIDTIKAFKRNATTKNIPIIMATGIMTSSENLKTALEAGAIDYIRKPVDVIELLARVNTALRLSNSFIKIQKQNEELELRNQTRERLLAIIAHDIQSPLSSLKGGLSIAREIGGSGISRETFLDILDQIESEFWAVIELMNSLLIWALNKQNAFTLKSEPIKLSNLISRNLQLIDHPAKKKDVRITHSLPEDITIYSDLNMIRFIVRNLLANALKFTPSGGSVSLDIETKTNGICLMVKDTGIGMSKSQQEHLFDSIDPNKVKSDTYGKRGTGLGLAVIQEFVEKLQGKVWVESKLREGSTFFVEIPDCLIKK